MTALRVGVIGTGFGRQVQIPAFAAHPRTRVVAVASAFCANAASPVATAKRVSAAVTLLVRMAKSASDAPSSVFARSPGLLNGTNAAPTATCG